MVLNLVSASEKKGAYCTYANKILNYNKRCLKTEVCHIVARFQVIMTLNDAVYTLDKHHVDIATPCENMEELLIVFSQ